MTESTSNPLSGLWKPHQLQALHYGPGCVAQHLLSCLPTSSSKAFIITGSSLASKTPLIKELEALLTPAHHAGTFSDIKQHAPVGDLDRATEQVARDEHIDTLVAVGGGSPIDSAKAISMRQHDKTGRFLHLVAIPTTLSAAECTALAGYTKADGVKTGLSDPRLGMSAILYDPRYAAHTPRKLWLATGLRALDHAIETMYHPSATEVPARMAAMHAAGVLFADLPRAAQSHPGDEQISTRLFLAAFASLGFMGTNMTAGLGLSHALGYALGSPYGIPHGETSCLTLSHVVKLKAKGKAEDAEQLARMLPAITGGTTPRSGDDRKDAVAVGDAILKLVDELGLHQSLSARGVGKDQVDIITQRATGGQKEGPVYDAVKGLVQGLY